MGVVIVNNKFNRILIFFIYKTTLKVRWLVFFLFVFFLAELHLLYIKLIFVKSDFLNALERPYFWRKPWKQRPIFVHFLEGGANQSVRMSSGSETDEHEEAAGLSNRLLHLRSRANASQYTEI